MNKKYILLVLFLFVSSTLIYYFGFYNKNVVFNSKTTPVSSERNFLNILDKRKSFENPLTGEIIFSESRPEFLNHKPLGVMINNATPARPQAGISKADVVYEIVAEGGITRFLAIFLSDLPDKVGPIRSVREYYLEIVKELGDSMLMHIGYSPGALEKIKQWNVLSLGLAGADFYRDSRGNPSVAIEHTAFASAKDLFTFGDAIKYNTPVEFKSWKFNENLDRGTLVKANEITINFWYEGDYTGFFKYDKEKNEYVRYSGIVDGKPQILIDDLTKTEVRFKNVVVQFANENAIPNDEKNRLEYELISSGKALIFRDGVVINATWKKDDLKSRTIFYDLNGKEVEFNRGKIWVSVVPSRNENQVLYKE